MIDCWRQASTLISHRRVHARPVYSLRSLNAAPSAINLGNVTQRLSLARFQFEKQIAQIHRLPTTGNAFQTQFSRHQISESWHKTINIQKVVVGCFTLLFCQQWLLLLENA